MNEQDKELLFIDLLGRIPYNLKCEYKDELYEIIGYAHGRVVLVKPFMSSTISPLIEEVKPYLFPMSSMTEEQREEYESLCIKETSECTDLYSIIFTKDYYYDTIESIDFLYKNHIDIRGLIPKGLGIDSSNLNIY